LSAESKRSITFLLGLVQSRPASKPLGEVTRRLAEVHGIGSVTGTKVRYSSADFGRAGDLLKLEKIDPSTSPDAWKAVGRTDSWTLRGNEKWAGVAASAGLVAVTCLPSQSLRVANANLLLPEGSHLVLPADQIVDGCDHDSIIVVENLEPFRRCGRWHKRYLAARGEHPLFVFRGENDGTRADAVNALLLRTSIPVFGAFDVDPAGLGTALTLPRLDGLVAPDTQELDSHLGAHREASSGRADLYQKQYAHWAPSLERTSNKEVLLLWEVVRRHGEGLVQEAFLERHSLAPTDNDQ
jgi:hypothetical protein